MRFGRPAAALLDARHLVLMHVGSNPADGSTLDADALASVTAAVRARGYRLVALPGFIEQR